MPLLRGNVGVLEKALIDCHKPGDGDLASALSSHENLGELLPLPAFQVLISSKPCIGSFHKDLLIARLKNVCKGRECSSAAECTLSTCKGLGLVPTTKEQSKLKKITESCIIALSKTEHLLSAPQRGGRR